MSLASASLTAKQLQALRLVDQGQITGKSQRYVWRFGTSHEAYTAAVKVLKDRGLVDVTYYRDFAGVTLTDAGRAALKNASAPDYGPVEGERSGIIEALGAFANPCIEV